jgi:hypothetical protein
MAQAFTHEVLSGSTHGLGIKVTGTSSAADVTVHTAIAGTTSRDELWLYAQNNDADGETRTLTIAFGGETSPDNLIIVPVPCRAGPVLVVPGLPLRNTLVVGAWADEADDVIVYGYVNRVTVS